MSVPSKIHKIQLVEIQPEVSCRLRTEPGLVTGYGEAGGMGYWAETVHSTGEAGECPWRKRAVRGTVGTGETSTAQRGGLKMAAKQDS
jgi:hypothetical protein